MFEKISVWLADHGGFFHVLAAIVGFLVLGFSIVPAFHTLCIDVWAKTPAWVCQLALAAAGLYTLYTTQFANVKRLQLKAVKKQLALSTPPKP